jgi:hypothetical protein
VVTGDSGCEAYTAIAWGVGLSHERSDIAGAESFYSLEGNMCGTLCKVLTPCRGLRSHHVQRDRIGTWEVSRLTAGITGASVTAHSGAQGASSITTDGILRVSFFKAPL